MNKKTLGIAIPYRMTIIQCEEPFKKLMQQVKEQLNEDMLVYVYEDGQYSSWLDEYAKGNIKIVSDLINYGVSYARNKCLDYLLDKVNYILFLDADDKLDDDYLEKMYKECKRAKYKIIESGFYVRENKAEFNANVVRCGVVGSAIKSSIIGNVRFDENLQIGEDTKFMKQVCDLNKYTKKYVDTNYYYQLGINEMSLTMMYANKIIGKER